MLLRIPEVLDFLAVMCERPHDPEPALILVDYLQELKMEEHAELISIYWEKQDIRTSYKQLHALERRELFLLQKYGRRIAADYLGIDTENFSPGVFEFNCGLPLWFMEGQYICLIEALQKSMLVYDPLRYSFRSSVAQSESVSVNGFYAIYCPNRRITYRTLASRVKAWGFGMASLPELCVFSINYPASQYQWPIVGTGGYTSAADRPCMLSHERGRSNGTPTLSEVHDVWSAKTRFLVPVR